MKLLHILLLALLVNNFLFSQDNEFTIQIQNAVNRTIVFEMIPVGANWARATECNIGLYNDDATYTSSLSGGSLGYVDCNYNGFEYRFYNEGNYTDVFGCAQSTAGLKPLRNGFYRVNIKENNVLKAYAYFDWRDLGFPVPCVDSCTGNDFTIRYNAQNEKILFWNSKGISINITIPNATLTNGQIITWAEWKCTGRVFAPFWSNGLVLAPDKSNHPRIVWGPYQESGIIIQHYKIYKKKGTGNFNLLTTTAGFYFIDENEFIPTLPSTQVPVYYYVKAYGQLGESIFESGPTNTVSINVRGGFDKINQTFNNNFPDSYALLQNYPNPFNPSTKIKFSLKETGYVKLEVFNTIGERVKELVNSDLPEGIHEVSFNASSLSSGMYIYKLQAGSYTDVKKMILAK